MKKFLILQLRPEKEAADNEFAAFLKFGQLLPENVERIRIEKDGVPDHVDPTDYSGIIIGGGPSNVSDDEEKKFPGQQKFEADLHKLLDVVVTQDIPFLGACYGVGILGRHQGARISKERFGEGVGAVTIHVTEAGQKDALLTGLPDTFRAFVGHKEACRRVPESATLLASSDTCPVQMFRVKENIYATQFHPELDADGLITRIGVYKHAGYFPPEDAEKLITQAKKEEVTVPEKILFNFVQKYSMKNG